MKLSYQWLKQYVNVDYSPQEMDVRLTDCGLEVEGFEKFQSVKGGLEGVVIGKVLTKEKHPNADKLSITTVDVGTPDKLKIVCGASNVEAGQTVPVATIGTNIYSGEEVFTIKKSKIRGELSEGMICAEDELGIGKSHDGIMVLEDNIKAGTKAADYFNITADYIYEIGLTPNRSDATSHIGSARDLVAIHNVEKKQMDVALQVPGVEDVRAGNSLPKFDLSIEDSDACPRYSGIVIDNITIKESPAWLKNRLESIGIRSINNLVDTTNYVMLETGQPLHAFDMAKVFGEKVIVKKAQKGTNFTTLDEVERKLTENDLMICDAEKPMCIAGVFGGINSGITEKTTSIFLESAYFEATGIRKTSKYHGLKTDASFRYERGADPEITIYALKRTLQLLQEICGGKAATQIVDVYPSPQEKNRIELFYKYLDTLVGQKINKEEIEIILKSLDFDIVESREDGIVVDVHTAKVDVTRPCDLVEEIIRIYGYNKINVGERLISSISYTNKKDPIRLKNQISDLLVNNAYLEMMNNSLTKEAYYEKHDFQEDRSVKMLNPLSNELNVLRRTLIFGALESVSHNVKRQNSDVSFFEFGKTYEQNPDLKHLKVAERYKEKESLLIVKTGRKEEERWNTTNEATDYFDIKSIVHKVLQRLGIANNLVQKEGNNKLLHDQIEYIVSKKSVVTIGKITNILLGDFDLKQDVFCAILDWDMILEILDVSEKQVKTISKYPEVRRDLALVVDDTISFEKLKEIAYDSERKNLKSVNLFDVYKGDKIDKAKKSYAMSFILQDENKTLTDKYVEKVMNKILKQIQDKTSAVLR
jgi:phenylalanyl-tRNA synthetase beta chain